MASLAPQAHEQMQRHDCKAAGISIAPREDPCWRDRIPIGRPRGFTLIEVLVVLFIVSMMTGLVVVNLPNFAQTDDFQFEAERLKAVLDLARQEASMQSSELGFKLVSSGADSRFAYSFYRYDERRQSWQVLEEKPFEERLMPADIRASIKVEGEDMVLGDESSPPVLILSSGEMTPLQIQLVHSSEAGLSRELTTDGYSDLEWVIESSE